MREQDELDLLLDSALSSYADPGPHSGLENRILAALEKARIPVEGPMLRAAPRRRWLPWAIAIPVAACLLLWIATAKIKHTPSTRPEQAYTSNRTQTPSAGEPIAAPGPKIVQKIRPSRAKAPMDYAASSARLELCPATKPNPSIATDVPSTAPFPRLDVFPTPQPLTPQEQALAVIAAQTPAPELQALLAAQTQDEVPFPIAATHVPPLEPPDSGTNDRQ